MLVLSEEDVLLAFCGWSLRPPEQVAAPAFMLVDFLLSRQRIARYLFDSFRQPANLKKVLQARPRVCGEMY